jgi:putative ABC transport system permease protein
MPFHYLKPSLRNLFRKKVITSINILGLSIGISAALVIYLIVQYDYSFDRYEPDAARIYRVFLHEENFDNAGVPVPLPRSLAPVTGIEKSTFLMDMNEESTKVAVPQAGNKSPGIFRKQDKFVFADSNYFAFFPHQWLAGSPAVSLKNPYQLVLTENLAKRYFPDIPLQQIVGRTLMIDDSIGTVVSGIVKGLAARTDFDHEAFIALATIPAGGLKDDRRWEDWGSVNGVNQVLLKLSPGVSAANVGRQISKIYKQHTSRDDKSTMQLQPLSDIHFNERLEGKVSKPILVNLTLLAVFILLLGSINFINLSTAQASERAKEIGMRKILGSSKGQLVARFLSETYLLTIISTVFSLLITPLLIRGFADFMPEGLDVQRLWQPHTLLFLVILIGVVGFISGIYPALVLTGIKPLSVTKNQTLSATGSNHRVWLRQTLTVSQFVIAQVFIIGVLVVNRQIHFAMQKDMGFRKDAIVNFYVPFDFSHPNGKKFVLLQKLRSIPEIQAVSLGNQPPAIGGSMSTRIKYHEGKKDLNIPVDVREGDTGFISLYHIRLLAGRNVLPSDSSHEYLVNETLARILGFQQPADAVGHLLKSGHDAMIITGVMADFHLASVRTAIHPMVFSYDQEHGYVMHVALSPSPGSWNKAIAKMQLAWREVYPDQDFDYQFLDKTIAGFYQQEQQLSKLLSWAAGVAILISCLGLLGLVIFTANQRTKEIGIRKVLGASVAQIITLLSRDFVRLVALAFIIAVPFAWWATRQWLQNFAYHTELSWWIFAIGGIAMLAIALLILCLRAGKAALENPVNCLRTE